jgi:RecB family exonuclease
MVGSRTPLSGPAQKLYALAPRSVCLLDRLAMSAVPESCARLTSPPTYDRLAVGRMNLRLLTAHPAALEPALAHELASLREKDQLAPISILVGGTLLRPYLRRRLAELSGAHINVHLLTPAELGLRLAEPRPIAAGRRPISALADRALVHEVAREASGYFAPVKDTPGFAEVLGRLFRELRGAMISSAEFSTGAGKDGHDKHAELAELYARYCDARAPFYDGDDCVAAIEPRDSKDLATLVYGMWQMQPSLRGALERIAGQVPVTVFLPQTGTTADVAHVELRAWLAAHEAKTIEPPGASANGTALAHLQERLFAEPRATAPDATVSLLSTPDPNREAREAVRSCLDWARDGVPLYDIAIGCRNIDTYRQFVESACREAGITVYVHSGTQLTERPLGRQVLALLDLIGSDLPRATLMELFAELRLPEETWNRLGGMFSTRWDSISRKAGVVRGLEQWRERLSFYIEGQQELEGERVDAADKREEAEKNGETEKDIESHARARENVAASLLRFVEELAERFAARHESATWSEHIAFLTALLDDYVDGSAPLAQALAPLTELDDVSEPVSFERFRDAVRATIEGLRVEDVTEERPAAFARRGLNLLDVNSLRHVRFGAVAVLGLTERAFPPPARQDPLLLDEERRSLSDKHGWELPLRAHGADPEPLQFTLAVCAARERLALSFARAEEAGGRAKLPSSFFRAAGAALTGARVTADDIDSLDERFFHRAGAGRIGAAELEQALSEEDYDRTLLESERCVGARALAQARPAFAHSRALIRDRWAEVLTPYDGVLEATDTRELLARAWGEERAFSPTGLEGYATCPYRFFLSHVLGTGSVEEPEEIERISALDKGLLMHGVFRSYLEEQRTSPAAGKTQLKRLLAIAAEECDHFERLGVTGYPLLWRHDRGEILADLAAWYRIELEDEDLGRYDDADFEVGFGLSYPGEQSGRLSRDEPIALDLAGTRTHVHGRIDRLEWRVGERFRVIDYKTGSSYRRPADDALSGGQSLQLPVYMIAAAELLSIAPERGSAQYLYASRRGRFLRASFDGAKLGDPREDVRGLLRELVEGVRGGDFHAQPSKDACRYCDFNGVCDATRERDLERKSGDPRVQRFELRGEEYE